MTRFASLLICVALLTAMGCCCGRGYNACYAPPPCPGGACDVGAPIGAAPAYPTAGFYNSYGQTTASAPITVAPGPVAAQPGVTYPTTATTPIVYPTTSAAPMHYPATAAMPVQSLPTY